jgi:hypothetical protein
VLRVTAANSCVSSASVDVCASVCVCVFAPCVCACVCVCVYTRGTCLNVSGEVLVVTVASVCEDESVGVGVCVRVCACSVCACVCVCWSVSGDGKRRDDCACRYAFEPTFASRPCALRVCVDSPCVPSVCADINNCCFPDNELMCVLMNVLDCVFATCVFAACTSLCVCVCVCVGDCVGLLLAFVVDCAGRVCVCTDADTSHPHCNRLFHAHRNTVYAIRCTSSSPSSGVSVPDCCLFGDCLLDVCVFGDCLLDVCVTGECVRVFVLCVFVDNTSCTKTSRLRSHASERWKCVPMSVYSGANAASRHNVALTLMLLSV